MSRTPVRALALVALVATTSLAMGCKGRRSGGPAADGSTESSGGEQLTELGVFQEMPMQPPEATTAAQAAPSTTVSPGGEAPAPSTRPPGPAPAPVSTTPPVQATADSGADEPAASPWGATRAEQCRPPARNPLSAAARPDFEAGLRAAAAGDIDGAAASFRQSLRADRDAYPAAYNLGVLADRAGHTAEALEFYRQALRIQGDYEPAAQGMVTVFFRQGSPPDAYAFIQPLARRYPTNLYIQALFADVLVKMGRFDAAWDAARAALRCDERFVPALLALVRASRAQGRDELADSILAQALAIDPRDAELHFLEGMRLRGQPGRLRDAMDELRRAVALRPDYIEARMALGTQLLSGGNYPEALQQFEAAARLAPTLIAVRLSLADALRANRQWERARAEYDRVLQMNPNLAEAHFGLGLLYLTAAGEIPGMEELPALQQAVDHLTRYRNIMGPRLPRDDPSATYLADLDRRMQRLQRRLDRERRQQQQSTQGDASGDAGGSS